MMTAEQYENMKIAKKCSIHWHNTDGYQSKKFNTSELESVHVLSHDLPVTTD